MQSPKSMLQLEEKGENMILKIDNIADLDLSTLSLDSLNCKFHTGHSYLKSQSGRTKEYGYRTGVMTSIGDIEISVWIKAVESIIRRDNEWDLQLKLREWYKDSFAEKDNLGALENHAARLYKNINWVDYRKFKESC